MVKPVERKMKPYRPRPDREKRLTSSVKAAEALVGLDLYPQHKRELLSICVWKATELDGKWNTRFCSRGALEADPDTKLNHEHVVERAKLVDRMLAGVTVDKVLKSAVACVVTVAEHKRLTERSRLALDCPVGAWMEGNESWSYSSPICGWIIANHLDNALMIYDAAGSNLGCLIVGQTGGTPHEVLRWDPCSGDVVNNFFPPDYKSPPVRVCECTVVRRGGIGVGFSGIDGAA